MAANPGMESDEWITVMIRRCSRRAFAVPAVALLSLLAAILPANAETQAASSNREAIVSMRVLRYRSERLPVNTRMSQKRFHRFHSTSARAGLNLGAPPMRALYSFLLLASLFVRADAQSPGAGDSALPAWKPGAFYLRTSANPPQPLLGRNVTGVKLGDFQNDFSNMAAVGETLARIHLMHGRKPGPPAGEIDEEWLDYWSQVFDAAEGRGIYVLPVFDVWSNWNDGAKGEPWPEWAANPYNLAAGGFVASPSELLADGPCRERWLHWLAQCVRRWRDRRNIAAWEAFSEVDLVSGANAKAAGAFTERAARAIRSADPRRHPVTISLSGAVDWPEVFGAPSIDFVQVHPYADVPRFSGNLDELVLSSVHDRLRRYGKPVFFGESGLDSRSPTTPGTLTGRPESLTGLRFAVWAGALSGALSARMLWWEDGYAKYSHLDLSPTYQDVSAPVVRFMDGVDFSGFQPLELKTSADLFGAALGNDRQIVGWFRDVNCRAPDWPMRDLEAQSVTIPADGQRRVHFFNWRSGHEIFARNLEAADGSLVISLPQFEGAIVFRVEIPQ
jgi:hypothetical protein